MDTGKRPQTHGKKTGQGSVSVNKTDKVETGGKPVGSGPARPQSPYTSSGSQQRPSSSRGVRRAAGGGSSLLVILILAFLLLRGCNAGSAGAPVGTVPQDVPATAAATAAPTAPPTAAPTAPPTAAPAAPAAQGAATAAGAGREHRYVPLGGGRDTVTVMVYMCGTDLESNYGMATSDLQEMISARIGSNVNVLVETGGCKMWKNQVVSSSSNEIYKVESGGLRRLQTLPRAAMVESSTLTSFINFCKTNYPADRNILIFWDHGGGSISGYGYDEVYKSAGSMDLAEISQALKAAGCTFDWIGFDACLMATLETAVVCNDYADYMIASEETEPGTGWYYTNWLTMLSNNTSVDTVALGKQLIDDFINTNKAASSSPQVTLSLVDLAEMQGTVLPALRAFSVSTAQMLSNNSYSAVSQARAGSRQFARSSRINQIDLVDFANRIGTAESRALAQALLGCVKHNGTTISNSYGISIYFPYETTSSVKTAVSTYNQVGMDAEYTKFISSFASLASSGQLGAAASTYGSGLDLSSLLGAYLGGSSGYGSGSSYGSASPLGSLLGAYTGSGGSASAGSAFDANSMMQLLSAFAGSGRSLPAELDWVDTDVIGRNVEYIAANYIDPGDITVTVRDDGQRVLSLTEEQWDLINTMELNVFVDDGAGYIDLGYDNVGYYFDDNGDAVLDFDGTWLTVNGSVAAFYMESVTEEADGSVTTRGVIPAMLTHTTPATGGLTALDGSRGDGSAAAAASSQLVYLEVVFDEANPYGAVTGARPMYEEDVEGVAKGGIELTAGDRLEFLCDYYAYDGSYDGAYKLDSGLTVGGDGLEIVYLEVDGVCSVTYRLSDIYGNYFWTPAWIA